VNVGRNYNGPKVLDLCDRQKPHESRRTGTVVGQKCDVLINMLSIT